MTSPSLCRWQVRVTWSATPRTGPHSEGSGIFSTHWAMLASLPPRSCMRSSTAWPSDAAADPCSSESGIRMDWPSFTFTNSASRSLAGRTNSCFRMPWPWSTFPLWFMDSFFSFSHVDLLLTIFTLSSCSCSAWIPTASSGIGERTAPPRGDFHAGSPSSPSRAVSPTTVSATPCVRSASQSPRRKVSASSTPRKWAPRHVRTAPSYASRRTYAGREVTLGPFAHAGVAHDLAALGGGGFWFECSHISVRVPGVGPGSGVTAGKPAPCGRGVRSAASAIGVPRSAGAAAAAGCCGRRCEAARGCGCGVRAASYQPPSWLARSTGALASSPEDPPPGGPSAPRRDGAGGARLLRVRLLASASRPAPAPPPYSPP